jgi:hypothetical protein
MSAIGQIHNQSQMQEKNMSALWERIAVHEPFEATFSNLFDKLIISTNAEVDVLRTQQIILSENAPLQNLVSQNDQIKATWNNFWNTCKDPEEMINRKSLEFDAVSLVKIESWESEIKGKKNPVLNQWIDSISSIKEYYKKFVEITNRLETEDRLVQLSEKYLDDRN